MDDFNNVKSGTRVNTILFSHEHIIIIVYI